MRKVMVGLAVLGLVAQAAVAQTATRQFQFGPQGSFATEDIGPGVGARVVYDLGATVKIPGLKTHASFDYFFPGNSLTYWEINAAGTYELKISGMNSLAPYVGGGLTYANMSCSGCIGSYTDTGLSVLGGARFKVGAKMNAFAEGRFELRGGGALVLTGGLLF